MSTAQREREIGRWLPLIYLAGGSTVLIAALVALVPDAVTARPRQHALPAPRSLNEQQRAPAPTKNTTTRAQLDAPKSSESAPSAPLSPTPLLEVASAAPHGVAHAPYVRTVEEQRQLTNEDDEREVAYVTDPAKLRESEPAEPAPARPRTSDDADPRLNDDVEPKVRILTSDEERRLRDVP